MTVSDETSASAEYTTALEEIYTQIKRVSRELRPTDRIMADLDIDSLATVELLLALEDRFGMPLVTDPRTAKVETIGDLIDLLATLRAESAT